MPPSNALLRKEGDIAFERAVSDNVGRRTENRRNHLRRVLVAVFFWCGSVATVSADEVAADSAESRGNTLIPIPFYFYSPETESGFGALMSYLFRPDGTPDDRPSSLTAIFVYTTKSQASLTLEGEVYLSGGRNRLRGAVGVSEFPNTFWGVGNDTPDDLEEDYTPRGGFAQIGVERRFAGVWYVGPNIKVFYREMAKTEADGLIDTRAVSGTEDGWVTSAGATLTRDSRDDTVYPRSGTLHVAELDVADGAIGSDHAYTRIALSSAVYTTPWSTHVLAARVTAQSVTANPPFDLLPGLGGDTLLRGYYAGRYRERNMVTAQIEYRLPVWRRIGAVLFAGAGQVAHDVDAFRADGIHASGGFGLRVLVSRAEGLNLRADIGTAETGSGFYLGIGEAF